jgi:hypothetical protein
MLVAEPERQVTEPTPTENQIARSRLVLAVIGLLSLGACHRPEYYIVACDPEPASRSTIAWQITSAHPGVIRGRILAVGTGEPINPAHNVGARLLPGDSSWHRSGSDGEFQFSGVQGSRQLSVRAFGFMLATVSITVPPDSGIDVLAALESRRMTINEICGTRQKR